MNKKIDIPCNWWLVIKLCTNITDFYYNLYITKVNDDQQFMWLYWNRLNRWNYIELNIYVGLEEIRGIYKLMDEYNRATIFLLRRTGIYFDQTATVFLYGMIELGSNQTATFSPFRRIKIDSYQITVLFS